MLGINKFSSINGTVAATITYLRKIPLDKKVALPATLATFLASGLGAYLVTFLPEEMARPIIIAMLAAVLAYTWTKKGFGEKVEEPPLQRKHVTLAIFAIAIPIGFYDGFLGPGTGGFFIFAIVQLLSWNMLKAAAFSKLLNAATNLAALLFFAFNGHMLWDVALPMGLFNIAGGVLGSRLALKRGVHFIRKIFLLVTTLLLAKMLFDLTQ